MSDEDAGENGAAAVTAADGGNTTDPGDGTQKHEPGKRTQEHGPEDGAQEQGPEQDPSAQPEPAPARVPVLRRLLRSRTARAVTAAGLAGALLGAGAVAWRTGTLPLVGPAPCWDSLGDSAMSDLFGDRRTEVEEQTLQADPVGRGDSYGQCRITSYKDDRARRQVTLRVHRLDGLRGTDGRDWPAEFLTAGMVPLGDGLPGLSSSSRAWLALPQSCTGRDEFTGPTVVDIAMGPTGLDLASDYEREDRAALTRAVVEATNGVIRDFGCSGTYRTPRTLPAPMERKETDADAFCGAKGFTLPEAHRKDLTRTRVGGDGGPARVCEAGGSYNPAVRLTTVTDAALSEIFSSGTLRTGLSVKGSKGSGSIDGTRAVYRASCQTGPVVFVVEQLDHTEHSVAGLARELLPGYVAAEAERIGCGPEKVTLPGS
ncbi:hypothetical protein [Streptomyces sp. NBC_01363]|uniref:hypothetical protein n=1 Tax=Streptomyces sp. NBC_01363 TaxID=2903840 RepID=UPI00225694AC|nr:hypothetical protein [Streptomyces sp. NBC_01363]MCX4733075.1 hypothetical protein [Streptomyces sp. NBC_01363]